MGIDIDFPIIADLNKEVANLYGMIMPGESSTETSRCVFVIDDRQTLRAMIYYPLTTGRNVPEIVRLIEALQTTDQHGVSTPANWQPGERVIVPPRRPRRRPRNAPRIRRSSVPTGTSVPVSWVTRNPATDGLHTRRSAYELWPRLGGAPERAHVTGAYREAAGQPAISGSRQPAGDVRGRPGRTERRELSRDANG